MALHGEVLLVKSLRRADTQYHIGETMFRTVVIASVLAAGLGAAFAQSNAIEQRKKTFKEWGGAAGAIGKMLRGEEAFALAPVQAGLKTIQSTAKAQIALFPADSKTGGDTKALPAIWDNKAKFDAMFVKLEADTTAALAAIKDEASFKAEMPKVVGSCGACHKEFRAQ